MHDPIVSQHPCDFTGVCLMRSCLFRALKCGVCLTLILSLVWGSLCVMRLFYLFVSGVQFSSFLFKVPCFFWPRKLTFFAFALAHMSRNMSQPAPPFGAHISIREIYYPPQNPPFWLPSAFCVWGTERDMPLNLPPFMASP